MASKLQNMPFNVHRQIYTLELAPGLFFTSLTLKHTLTPIKKKNRALKMALGINYLKIHGKLFPRNTIILKYSLRCRFAQGLEGYSRDPQWIALSSV